MVCLAKVHLLHELIRSSFKCSEYPSVATIQQTYDDLSKHYEKKDITASVMNEVLNMFERSEETIAYSLFDFFGYEMDWRMIIEDYADEDIFKHKTLMMEYIETCFPLIREMYSKQCLYQSEKLSYVIKKNKNELL